MKLGSAVINKNCSGFHHFVMMALSYKQLCSNVLLASQVDLAQTKAIFRRLLCGTSLGEGT